VHGAPPASIAACAPSAADTACSTRCSLWMLPAPWRRGNSGAPWWVRCVGATCARSSHGATLAAAPPIADPACGGAAAVQERARGAPCAGHHPPPAVAGGAPVQIARKGWRCSTPADEDGGLRVEAHGLVDDARGEAQLAQLLHAGVAVPQHRVHLRRNAPRLVGSRPRCTGGATPRASQQPTALCAELTPQHCQSHMLRVDRQAAQKVLPKCACHCAIPQRQGAACAPRCGGLASSARWVLRAAPSARAHKSSSRYIPTTPGPPPQPSLLLGCGPPSRGAAPAGGTSMSALRRWSRAPL
jgi:hypothetical protein